MADTVRYLMERMVPELEDLERRGFFTRAELAEVVRRRQDYEYSLKRTAARLPDYLRAIEYEKKLERLRLARRRAQSLRGKASLADRCIVQRVHFIYRRATSKFRGNLALWGEWLQFCHFTRSGKLGGRVLRRALALHPRCAALWTHAAAWALQRDNDMPAARALMQEGLRACAAAHDAAEALWVEYFRLELVAAARLRARRAVLGIADDDDAVEGDAATNNNDNDEEEGGADIVSKAAEKKQEAADAAMKAVLRGSIALIAFRSALREASEPTVAFLSRFLTVLHEMEAFEGADEIEEAIYSAIADRTAQEPCAWMVLARRAQRTSTLSGLHAAVEVLRQGEEQLNADDLKYTITFYELAVEYLVEQAVSSIGSATEGQPNHDPDATALQDLALREAANFAGRAVDRGLASARVMEYRVSMRIRAGELMAAKDAAVQAAETTTGVEELNVLAVKCSATAALAEGDAASSSSGILVNDKTAVDSDSDDEAMVESLYSSKPVNDTILGAALERCPRSVEVWLAAIQAAIASGSDLLPLCRLLENAALLGKAGPVQGGLGLVAAVLLHGVYGTHGLVGARELYRSLSKGPSPGGEFWHAVLDLEVDLVPGVAPKDALPGSQVTALFESAVDAHGGEDIALWLRYMRYLATNGAGRVYWKAVKVLKNPEPFIAACQRERLA